MPVVRGEMVGHARDPAVQFRPAQLLGADHLAGGGAHQGRPAQKDRPLALDDDRFVGHRRHIGAARGARAHDQRDLRHPSRRQPRLVVEDPPEMVAVGKHLVLRRQIGPAQIDQIKAWQPVLAGDLLGAQVLFDGDREIGPALDRRVVGDDDAFAPHDPADPGHDPGRRHLAVIHAERRQRRQFEKRRARIEQQPHPLARQQFPPRQMPPPRRLPAPLLDRRELRPQIRDQPPHRRVIAAEAIGTGVERAGENGHPCPTPCPSPAPPGKRKPNFAGLVPRLAGSCPFAGWPYPHDVVSPDSRHGRTCSGHPRTRAGVEGGRGSPGRAR